MTTDLMVVTYDAEPVDDNPPWLAWLDYPDLLETALELDHQHQLKEIRP